MSTLNRRFSHRRKVDLQVGTGSGGGDFVCVAKDVSPTGIRLRRAQGQPPSPPISNLEIHLVPNAITTVITGRCVWRSDDDEAFEFVSPSFAQQMILERLSGNL